MKERHNLSEVGRYPAPRGKKYFWAPTNKNCRVWSEKDVHKHGRRKGRILAVVTSVIFRSK